ncbi:hypothetical protein [Streptomyces sp. NBC_01431]|uniref:hypothetical protein n=1 Tax=Streptomyces sp. NBC_01431 TaxID=2903863 RepID=UPI002E381A15|nr:hypothetical protein [Streptomyces sp. NBC_01431]
MTAVATGLPDASGYTLLPGGRVLHPDGYTVAAATAALGASGVPANTTRGRFSRMGAFVTWCRENGRLHSDAGALADYAAHLAALHHPAETITTYVSTIIGQLAAARPAVLVLPSELVLIRGIVAARAHAEAQDDDGQGDALQAAECSRADLLAMLATLDRTTVAGVRDALALILAWHMAGRASEPGTLRLRDVAEVTVEYPDPDGGAPLTVAGLTLTLRLSKTNPYGLTADRIQLLESGDAACPVAAWRAWAAVLDANRITSGPLLRRVRHNRITTAGRPPKDPARAGGFGDRAVRNLIARCARIARLVRALEPAEVELLSTRVEREHLATVEDPAARDAHRAELRLRRRALRRTLPRWSGHSMRRGRVRHLQHTGAPVHIIERQCRYARGSRALARYLDPLIAWADHPDRPGRTAPSGPRIVHTRT